ncbi:hypothetical protein AgCh_032639 [Apium graveolens]
MESKLPRSFWAKAVNIANYVLNRVPIRPLLNKTQYELLRKKKHEIGYFKVFGSKYFVLKTFERDGKFDSKSYEAIYLGNSLTGRAYRVCNLSKNVVEESIDISFQESNDDLLREEEDVAGTDETLEQLSRLTLKGPRENRAIKKLQNMFDGEYLSPSSKRIRTNEEVIGQHSLPKYPNTVKNYPLKLIIGDRSEGIKTSKGASNIYAFASFLVKEEPNKINETLNEPPKNASIIDTKWGFKKKVDEFGNAIRNKELTQNIGYDNIKLKSKPMNVVSKMTTDVQGYYLHLWRDFIKNRPKYVLGIASGKLEAKRSRK